MRVAVLLAAGVGCMVVGRARAAPGDVLAESRFTRGADDWYTHVESQREDGPAVALELDRGAQRIKGGDMGDLAWYFVAPPKFLGDQRSFFHGALQYQLGHFVYDMTDGPPSAAVPDVVLESKARRLRLGARSVIRPNVASHSYSVPFSAEAFDKHCRAGASSSVCRGDGDPCTINEDCCSQQCVGSAARWYNLKTGRPARNSELLDVLSDLSVLKIRGGYYRGEWSARGSRTRSSSRAASRIGQTPSLRPARPPTPSPSPRRRSPRPCPGRRRRRAGRGREGAKCKRITL